MCSGLFNKLDEVYRLVVVHKAQTPVYSYYLYMAVM